MSWAEILAAATAALVAVFAYVRSKRTDAVTERSGVMANGRAGVAQAMEAMEATIETLHEDRVAARLESQQERADLRAEIAALKTEIAELKAEIVALRQALT